MVPVEKKYIVNSNDEKVAVQIDISTFNKMERLIEDYALGQYLNQDSKAEKLTLSEAKSFYNNLSKED